MSAVVACLQAEGCRGCGLRLQLECHFLLRYPHLCLDGLLLPYEAGPYPLVAIGAVGCKGEFACSRACWLV